MTLMQGVLNSTAVRQDFGHFIDNVIRNKPQLVKRSRDVFAAISLKHLSEILSYFTFSMTYNLESDGTYSGSLNQVDIVSNGNTIEELKKQFAKDLIEYAEEYMDDFDLYYNSTNRKSHFPYIINVLIQKDEEDVIKLINA